MRFRVAILGLAVTWSSGWAAAEERPRDEEAPSIGRLPDLDASAPTGAVGRFDSASPRADDTAGSPETRRDGDVLAVPVAAFPDLDESPGTAGRAAELLRDNPYTELLASLPEPPQEPLLANPYSEALRWHNPYSEVLRWENPYTEALRWENPYARRAR